MTTLGPVVDAMQKEGELSPPVPQRAQEEDRHTLEQQEAATTSTISQSSWRKKKRIDYNLRLKERRTAEWESLTDEQKGARKQERKLRLETSEKLLVKALVDGLKVCVDLGFDEHQTCNTAAASSSSQAGDNSSSRHDNKKRRHSEKESRSLCKQLCLSYNVLKNASEPVHLHITSYDEQSFVGTTLKQQGALNWKVSIHNQAPWDLFPVDDIVILSPDATEVLDTIDPHKVYVIGGIVDRSVRKEETLSVARSQKLTAKRLPVQEYIPDRQSHILNIDSVLNVLCVYQVERDWEITLRTVMPLRRQVSGGKKMRKLGHQAADPDVDDNDGNDEEPPVPETATETAFVLEGKVSTA